MLADTPLYDWPDTPTAEGSVGVPALPSGIASCEEWADRALGVAAPQVGSDWWSLLWWVSRDTGSRAEPVAPPTPESPCWPVYVAAAMRRPSIVQTPGPPPAPPSLAEAIAKWLSTWGGTAVVVGGLFVVVLAVRGSR